VPERIPALRLAGVPQPQRHVARDLASQREQARRIARLELDLRFADRRFVPTGPDYTPVEREFRERAIRERQRAYGTLEFGREDGMEPAADLALRKQLGVGCLVQQRDVERIAEEVPLEFVARVQARRGPTAAQASGSACRRGATEATPACARSRSGVS
jgi:hypothetical protein